MTVTQQQKVSYDSEADATSHSLTVTEPVEGRRMILVAAASAVLDTPSGWSLAISATNDPDVRIFHRAAPASFGTTVTFGSAFSCSASAVYMEYSGLEASPLDQTASQTSIASTGTTGTTTQAAELLIGAIGVGSSTTDGNWSAWTNSFVEEHDLASSGGGTNVSLGVSSREVAATGTYSTDATAASGSGPCGCIATFKAAPPPGPAVEATNESATTTAGTSHVVNLPTGIVSGDLLVVLMAIGSTAATVNTLAGWSEVLDASVANDLKVLVRQADGTEGSTVTFTTSASTRSADISYRISGAELLATQAPQISTVATGTSTGPNPSTVTPTGGAKDYLWIAAFASAGEEADDDTWCNSAPSTPSAFTNLLQKACGTAGTNLGGVLASAHLSSNASSMDPGAFNMDASLAWRAYTIAVHPGAAGIDLVVADAAQAQTADGVVLTQVHALAVAETLQAQSVDTLALTQIHQLVVQDAAQAQTADNVVLESGAIQLVVQDAAQAQSVDGVALTQVHQLSVADAAQAQVADGLALTQVHNLTVVDAAQAQTADSVALTQVHVLSVQDAGQAQVVDNVVLAVGGINLIVADTLHGQTVDGLTLTQIHQLVVADAAHGHSVDNVALAQTHVLTVADAVHAHSADTVDLFVGELPIPAGHPLTVPSATHQVTAGGGHRVTAPSRPTALEVS